MISDVNAVISLFIRNRFNDIQRKPLTPLFIQFGTSETTFYPVGFTYNGGVQVMNEIVKELKKQISKLNEYNTQESSILGVECVKNRIHF